MPKLLYIVYNICILQFIPENMNLLTWVCTCPGRFWIPIGTFSVDSLPLTMQRRRSDCLYFGTVQIQHCFNGNYLVYIVVYSLKK